MKFDVLMCVSPGDAKCLFQMSLELCLRNIPNIHKIHIVTPRKKDLEKINLIKENTNKIIIHEDNEIIRPLKIKKIDPWYQQQVIKLQADRISKKKFIILLGSDTLVRRKLKEDFFIDKDKKAKVFFNKGTNDKHFAYEKKRVERIAEILKNKLVKSKKYTDFIMDCNIWDRLILKKLKIYLIGLYGKKFYEALEPKSCKSLRGKLDFGEWTMYASFVLDILKIKPTMRNVNKQDFFQIHSLSDFISPKATKAKVVHIVPKKIHRNLVYDRNRIP